MKISDQIAELLKTRGAKVAALQDLVEKSEKEGRQFNADEANAFDQLNKEIEDIDAHAKRLQGLEDTIARTAAPVIRTNHGSRNRELPKGHGFARIVQLMATAQGNDLLAQRMAQAQFPDMPDMARYFEARAVGVIARAAVPGANTTTPDWAGVLTYATQLSGELIELVRAESILGQLPRLRAVPFNVRIPRETAVIGSAQWVGEGAPKPVGKGGYDFVTIPWAKAALIVAITEELARFSNPGAEQLMTDGLVRAIAQFLDMQFISTLPPVANVSPGGILNGLAAGQTFPSAGSTPQQIAWDISHAVSILTATNLARAPAWIMSPANRVAISSTLNAFGQPMFPTLMANNTLAGYPVATSAFCPPDILVLLDQDKILHASDPQIAVDVSREASIQLDGAPVNPPTPLVSLWQQNMIGIRAEKFEYWMRAIPQAVVEVNTVAYGAAPALAGTAGAPPPVNPNDDTQRSHRRA